MTGLVHLGCQQAADPRRVEADADRLLEHSPGWDLAVATCPACGGTFAQPVPRRPEVVTVEPDVDDEQPVETPRVLTDEELPDAARKIAAKARAAGYRVVLLGTDAWQGLRVEVDEVALISTWTAGTRDSTWLLHRGWHDVPGYLLGGSVPRVRLWQRLPGTEGPQGPLLPAEGPGGPL